MKKLKRVLTFLLSFVLIFGLCFPTSAKTISSAKADNIFFYAMNSAGKAVLLKVMPLSDLKKLSHGQSDGKNYCISTTDNYPTTQYCEGRGFTVSELVNYVKSVTTVKGASAVNFSGGDTLRFMATDSYGNYSRSWTCAQLYGVKRYYFEELYGDKGWNTGWEIAGEDNAKFGVTLDAYNAKYKDSDPYYAEKRAVFDTGVETTVILATDSYSGRTTSDALVASTEPGISSYIAANGGTVAGCLKNAISDEYALRLSLPMTEADLMAAHRTAYDNFKWIYNMRLDRANSLALQSLGTVAEAVPSFSRSGSTLSITFSCATSGASVYYGYDGAPQALYTGPVSVDVSDCDLSSNPVTIYATAVKEGYDDAGVLTFQYPGMAPSLKTVYSGMAGSELTFTAAEGISAYGWSAWTSAMNFITMKAPTVNEYVTVDKSKYAVDGSAKAITFDKSLFTDTGSYSFIFHATKYADKSVSVTMKKAAPTLSVAGSVAFGQPVTLVFSDSGYTSGLSVYVTHEGGSRTMISASYLDKTQSGQVGIKAEYFTVSSTAMPGAGTYTLELVNNSYTPASQTVTLTLRTGFTDVVPDAWYYAYVTELANTGIVNGVGSGLFVPEGTLTWGQAMKLLMLTVGYAEQPPTGTHWASGYMNKAVSDGLISFGKDPDDPISRLDFCRAAAKVLKAETTLTKSPFTDTDDHGVLALYEKGIINGMTETTFDPLATLTRAQISKIIWHIMNLGGKYA